MSNIDALSSIANSGGDVPSRATSQSRKHSHVSPLLTSDMQPHTSNDMNPGTHCVRDGIEVRNESNDVSIKATIKKRGSNYDKEEGWTEVKGKKSRRNSLISVQGDKYEVYISSKEQLPKQFAMARILKENKISNICQIKYLSAFKLRLQFESEAAANILFECEKLLERGWKFQKAMELSVCYGVIRDVDLDLADDEILQNISCPSPAKLLSFKRLNRRNRDEGGWCPSETIRLCFDGDYLPTYVCVCDINVKVTPYIHQVSQCSLCWRLGHIRKMCPGKIVICPKCGGHHENCNTSMFSCVNCRGNHISMSKTCPAYKKERKLREIMAEFRCTYRKALECYVPPENSNPVQTPVATDCRDSFPYLQGDTPPKIFSTPETPFRSSYAKTLQAKNTIHNAEDRAKSTRHPVKAELRSPRNKQGPAKDNCMFWNSTADDKDEHLSDDEEDHKEQSPPFSELVSRLREVVFLQQASVSSKINSVIQLCLEWLMLVLVGYISKWPSIKKLFNFIIHLL